MSTRLYHIDNAKAIGMMLIVASHIMPLTFVTESQFYKTWCGILASFYVPLFFILSGVFEPSTSDFESVKRRMIKLIKYCVIFYVFGSFTYLSMFGAISWTGIRTQIGTVWFLFVLLWMTGIVGLLKHKKYSLLAFILLSMGGVILSYYNRSICQLGQALLCLPFYLFGYYAREYLKSPHFNYKIALSTLVGWIILYVCFYKEQNVSLNTVNQNYVAFYAEAILGSLSVIEICKLIQWKALAYYGRNTIVPMMVQMSLIFMMKRYLDISSMFVYFLAAAVICALSGLCIPVFRNRYYDLFK